LAERTSAWLQLGQLRPMANAPSGRQEDCLQRLRSVASGSQVHGLLECGRRATLTCRRATDVNGSKAAGCQHALRQLSRKRILLLREQRAMLDADLDTLYGVKTRVLVQAVKWNRARFPADFMF
jgi:hypothetical protein